MSPAYPEPHNDSPPQPFFLTAGTVCFLRRNPRCPPVSGRGRAVKGEDELTEPNYEAMVADRESCV